MPYTRPTVLTPPFTGRLIISLLAGSAGTGVAGAFGLGWLYGLSASSVILLSVVLASAGLCLCSTLLRRAVIRAISRPMPYPVLESVPDRRVGFRRVFAVSLSRRANLNISKNNENYSETNKKAELPYTPIQEFHPTTIVYDISGGYAASDTFNRDQALANARQALLSMDHTKHIPH